MIEVGKRFCLLGEYELSSIVPLGRTPIILKSGYRDDYVYDARRNSFLDVLGGLSLIGKSVVDVGTGIGLVAIAASKLGASLVVAVDPFAEAIIFATENFRLNGVKVTLIKDLSELSTQFDFVLCNIDVPSVYKELVPKLGTYLAQDDSVVLQATQSIGDILLLTNLDLTILDSSAGSNILLLKRRTGNG